MTSFKLYKKEKLCSKAAMDLLFSKEGGACSAMAYPLRAVWRLNPQRQRGAQVQILISVPKKRLRKAVDRVKMRRRIREAYRLNKMSLAMPQSKVDMAFVYISDTLQGYQSVEVSMRKLLDNVLSQLG